MLVFYVVGSFLRVWQKNFVRVFILAAVVSFVVVDLFLYYKIRVSQIPDARAFPYWMRGWMARWDILGFDPNEAVPSQPPQVDGGPATATRVGSPGFQSSILF